MTQLLSHARVRRELLAAWTFICISGNCRAQVDARSAEYRVKAAYLLQFLNYVEWPPQSFEGANSPVVVGIIGADSLADELSTAAATRKTAGRLVAVRKLRIGDSLGGLHVVFVARAESKRLKAVLASSANAPLLTVTESGEAFALGSTINFVVVDNKVRFDVALRPAAQKNLKISSRLLSVARKVVAAS